MTLAQTMQAWLGRITDDQNLKDLDHISNTPMSGERRWWTSRILAPFIKYGWYNPDTGKVALGSLDFFTNESVFTTVSVQALTLTCEAGYRYEVWFAACFNATQISFSALTCNIGGNAIDLAQTATGLTRGVGTIIGLAQTAAVADLQCAPIGLSPGDTLTLTCSAFAAGNNTEHYFIYRRYKVV